MASPARSPAVAEAISSSSSWSRPHSAARIERHLRGRVGRMRRGGPCGHALPADPTRTFAPMPLCFIEPRDAVRVIAESVGREARRQLLGELVRAWVDEIPDEELPAHYAKAVADLDEHDLSMLAAWHASMDVGQPIANRDFLVNAFGRLGEAKREALKIAAGFRDRKSVV